MVNTARESLEPLWRDNIFLGLGVSEWVDSFCWWGGVLERAGDILTKFNNERGEAWQNYLPGVVMWIYFFCFYYDGSLEVK